MALTGSIAATILLAAAVAAATHVEQGTQEGRVRGQLVRVIGKDVEEYRGIPFAEPPVGKRRFKPPKPKAPWEGTLDAVRTACPQLKVPLFVMDDVTYTEDCLHLNVWVPDRARQEGSKRPVLVWFHGGGFAFGGANYANYTGAVIAALTDVVVVSMNYRLGVLGFMSANTPEAPGNVGLLDQLLALKWVQRNIHSFGGDPDRVTLFGESAGAISVHAHIMSPMSEGLFKRGIMLSGTMYTIDTWDMVHESMVKGNKVANIVGCSKGGTIDLSSNADEIVDCFRRKSADELLKAAAEGGAPKAITFFPIYHDAFLPRMPLLSMNRGFFSPVDVLAGVTSDEGAILLLFPPKPDLLSEDLSVWDSEELADSLRDAVSSWMKEDIPDVLEKYTEEAPSGDNSALRRQYLDYTSDRLFNCPLRFFAEKHSERGNRVFTYVFDHKSTKAPLPSWMGVPHAADLDYTFGHPYNASAESPDDDGKMSEAFVRMMTSFAENGVPELPYGKKWPEFTKRSPAFIVMDHGRFNETKDFRARECERWRFLF